MAEDLDTITLAAELTAAWLGNPNTRVSSDDVPTFLSSMHQTLSKLSPPVKEPTIEAAPQEYTPAVSVRKSLASRDHIISMIDGKPYKTLKRHLATNGLTPAEYRERYGLKSDYPMVAPSYSDARRETAQRLGLGRKPGQKQGSKGAADTTSTQKEVPADAPRADIPAPKKSRAKKADAAPAEAPASEPKPRKRRSASDAKAAAKAHLGGDSEG